MIMKGASPVLRDPRAPASRRGSTARTSCPLERQLAFHVLKSRFELTIGALQCGFRIDIEDARDVGHHEQDVAEFILEAVMLPLIRDGRVFGDRFPEFQHFFLKLGENAFNIRPVKPDTAGAQ